MSMEATHAHAQTTLTTNLQQVQECFESSTQWAINNTCTYSQVTSSPHNTNSSHPPNSFPSPSSRFTIANGSRGDKCSLISPLI